MFFFINVIKTCWLAPGRVLASSEKNEFCQWHYVCLKESMKLFDRLKFDWLSVFDLLILVH